MKNTTFLLIFFLAFAPFIKLFPQITEAISYENPILTVKPKPVDKEVYDQWIKDNNKRFGEDPMDGPGVLLRVVVIFLVDTLGNVIDPQIVNGIGFGFDAEAQRLIKLNPNKWVPGSINGKLVNTRVYYMIDFSKNRNVIMTEKFTEYREKKRK